jgi:heptosyltransferase-1
MRVLLIKTSSLGDLVHTFPAITDASYALPHINFHWMVEDTFTNVPKWHPSVTKVIPVSLRKWRKKLFSSHTKSQLKALYDNMRDDQYDLVLDAQGLVKSALLSFFAKGVRAGLDFKSAREPFASFFYQHKYKVNFYQHAVTRMRLLFSQALHYPLPKESPQFGIERNQFIEIKGTCRTDIAIDQPYLVFLHGTTWRSKEWPLTYWLALAMIAGKAGFHIKLSGGNETEMERAHFIAKHSANVEVLPYLSIEEMAKCLANAQGVVAVDTGLGHLASALNVPTVSIYGATDPNYTGALGASSVHLAAKFPCAPCFDRTCRYKKETAVVPACYGTVKPIEVWESLVKQLATLSS